MLTIQDADMKVTAEQTNYPSAGKRFRGTVNVGGHVRGHDGSTVAMSPETVHIAVIEKYARALLAVVEAAKEHDSSLRTTKRGRT